MSQKPQSIAKKSKTAIIAYRIYLNWLTKRRFKSGNTESFLGSTHKGREVSESLAYIETQFADYLKYWAVEASDIKGKRILEVGFGDNIGVALKFIAAGASHVACLDKFYAKRDTEQERQIYAALRETLDENSKVRFDEAVDLTEEVRINPGKIKCIYGVDVEESEELAKGPLFDLIVSRGAIQDIYEPEKAFAAMDRLLVPGGHMLHKIDLSDQGMFRDHEMHPMTFLTISESVYRLMANGSGRPNRKLITDYGAILKELGYEGELLITDVFGRRGKGDLQPHKESLDATADYFAPALARVIEIRPRLISRYKKLSDEELMISGIFMIARKPTSPVDNPRVG
jgi:SAM-dependent methyltransferase